MPLRKVLLSSTALTNNAASFVNQTARRLHVRKVIGTTKATAALTAGDSWSTSLDEVPVSQRNVNDSRSHITSLSVGAVESIGMEHVHIILSFNRDDLVLDVDEALFMNNADIAGAPPTSSQWQIFYED